MPAMNIRWESSDPFNSEITDTATGQTIFIVSSPIKSALKREVTIRTPEGEVVGVFTHKFLKDATMTYHGLTRTIAEWMPRKNVVTGSRTFVAPSGQVYVWNQEFKGSFKLLDALTDAVAAQTHTESWKKKRKMSIDVEDRELVPHVDAVVLSFLVCEWEKRDAEHTLA